MKSESLGSDVEDNKFNQYSLIDKDNMVQNKSRMSYIPLSMKSESEREISECLNNYKGF